jgi:hypothetical protein
MENTIQAAKAEIYKRDILEKGMLEIIVNGNSMHPFLKNNDIVRLTAVKMEDIAIGDIVLTYNGMRMLCHRVFKIDKLSLQTKADALIWADLPVGKKDLIGKVVEKSSGKKIKRFDTNSARHYGFLISRFMVIGAFLYIPIRQLSKIIKQLSAGLSYRRQN